MRWAKSGYYLSSLFKICSELKNPWVLVLIVFGFKPLLKFRNGLKIKVQEALEVLVLKEIVLDDVYRIAQLHEPHLILDVGAGIGEFCIFVARQFPRARVVAFEPNPKQFQLLQENIEHNSLSNVEAHMIAIGLKSSYILESSAHGVRTRLNGEGQGSSIAGKPLAAYLGTERVNLLKIDCEGAEVEVLESLGSSNWNLIERFAIEYHNYLVEDADKALYYRLSSVGYTVEVASDRFEAQLGMVYAHSQAAN